MPFTIYLQTKGDHSLLLTKMVHLGLEVCCLDGDITWFSLGYLGTLILLFFLDGCFMLKGLIFVFEYMYSKTLWDTVNMVKIYNVSQYHVKMIAFPFSCLEYFIDLFYLKFSRFLPFLHF